MKNTYLICTESSAYLAELIAKKLRVPILPVEKRRFSDGERYYRLEMAHSQSLIGKNIIFVASTYTDDDFLELIRVGGAIASGGTERRIFAIPYFGYAAMERAVFPGEIVTAKENARMLSALPSHGMGNAFLLLDLHSQGILHYFEGDDLRFELTTRHLLTQAIKDLKLKDYLVATADLGRSIWVEKLATALKVDLVLISKIRDFETTKVRSVIGDVNGKTVVIYDDMIRSGGTLVQAAEAYLGQGAREIYAAVTHLALTSPEVVVKLEESPIKQIIATNSHPMSQSSEVQNSKKIILKDVSVLFADAITKILHQPN